VAKIFVSYRRDDASSEAGRITDWLDRHFGKDEVFMDITALEPGVDFVQMIEQAVDTIDALIAVIGPNWIDAEDDHGNRRLDDPTDWVRLEIANALRRGTRVIPVLVKGAAMPPAAKLPEDLRPLRRRNALPITERQWRAGVEELIKALDGVVSQPTPPARGPPPRPRTPAQAEQPKTSPPARRSWRVVCALVGVIVGIVVGLVTLPPAAGRLWGHLFGEPTVQPRVVQPRVTSIEIEPETRRAAFQDPDTTPCKETRPSQRGILANVTMTLTGTTGANAAITLSLRNSAGTIRNCGPYTVEVGGFIEGTRGYWIPEPARRGWYRVHVRVAVGRDATSKDSKLFIAGTTSNPA
jgi:hypothetical protein